MEFMTFSIIPWIATAVSFTVGVFLLPVLIPGVRVRGGGEVLKAAGIGGVLSVGLGKLAWLLLSLLFFPIRLLGPLGPVLAQLVVNVVLLFVGSRVVRGVQFKTWGALVWAGLALTALQLVVASIG